MQIFHFRFATILIALALTILANVETGDSQVRLQASMRPPTDSLLLAGKPHVPAVQQMTAKLADRTALLSEGQIFVIDSAIEISYGETRRHRYAFSASGKMTTDLVETWLHEQWENFSRMDYTYDTRGNESGVDVQQVVGQSVGKSIPPCCQLRRGRKRR